MENALFSDRALQWRDRCALIAAAGFKGVYATPYPVADADFARLRNLADEPHRHGLSLEAVYVNVDLALPTNFPANARVARLFAEVEGVPRIEISFKHSGPDAPPADIDTEICSRLEPLLEIAGRRGIAVALYPHSFYPLERPAHAERIVRRLNFPGLSFLFAASHVYAVSTAAETADQLRACAGRIASFNVCGCTRSTPMPPGRCTHHPLDEGDLPLPPLFAALRDADYLGSVIVQGHGWQGDLSAQLRRCVVTAEHLFSTSTPIQS